jgi:hypothetical protein
MKLTEIASSDDGRALPDTYETDNAAWLLPEYVIDDKAKTE